MDWVRLHSCVGDEPTAVRGTLCGWHTWTDTLCICTGVRYTCRFLWFYPVDDVTRVDTSTFVGGSIHLVNHSLVLCVFLAACVIRHFYTWTNIEIFVSVGVPVRGRQITKWRSTAVDERLCEPFSEAMLSGLLRCTLERTLIFLLRPFLVYFVDDIQHT